MAEIKIEKKKMVWPWILLGVVVIAVLIYFLAFHDNNSEMKEALKTTEIIGTNVPDLISVKENNSTVAAYVTFMETSRETMSLNHAYTNEALLKLIEATSAMAGEVGYEVRADLDKVKQYAEMITKDPFVTTQADNIRKADDVLTNILQNIQKAKHPGLSNEVVELKKASESIKPEVLALDQRNEVKTFFGKAADLLKKMN